MPSVIDHVRAAVTGDDADRLAKRREIKARIPAARERQARVVSLQQEISAAERELEAAAATHQSLCQPLQLELANATDEGERSRLRQQIDAANDTLESNVRKLHARIRHFQTERSQMMTGPAETPESLANELCRLASPELDAQHFVSQQAAEWTVRRLEHAQKQLEKWSAELNKEQRERTQTRTEYSERFGRRTVESNKGPSESERIYARRVRLWESEVAAAQALLQSARSESEKIRRAMIDEGDVKLQLQHFGGGVFRRFSRLLAASLWNSRVVVISDRKLPENCGISSVAFEV
jgi:hypothetical protein